jgi:hypothetical protein
MTCNFDFALMSPVNLKWVPLPVDGSIGPPMGLKDFQVGWFWNLFWASLKNAELPGYLPATRSNLWTVAGAHRPAHWDANCAVVMAAFELREIAGRKMFCLPALISILEEQTKKLQNHKKRVVQNLNSDPQASGELSPSQSEFCFEHQREMKEDRHAGTQDAAARITTNPYARGKRAQRVEQTRNVLRESLRRYGGQDA